MMDVKSRVLLLRSPAGFGGIRAPARQRHTRKAPRRRTFWNAPCSIKMPGQTWDQGPGLDYSSQAVMKPAFGQSKEECSFLKKDVFWAWVYLDQYRWHQTGCYKNAKFLRIPKDTTLAEKSRNWDSATARLPGLGLEHLYSMDSFHPAANVQQAPGLNCKRHHWGTQLTASFSPEFILTTLCRAAEMFQQLLHSLTCRWWCWWWCW